MAHLIVSSSFSGSSFSTSFFLRRSKNGLRTWCRRWMIRSSSSSFRTTSSLFAAKGALNQASKASVELNTEGSRKLRSDHSSVRLFWIGVPVSSSRWEAVYAA